MNKIKYYFLLHAILLMYSLGSVCSKIAANKKIMSLDFIIFYGLLLVILFLYAILWQQILKHVSLNIAYANKAVTLIWGMVWGILIFQEKIHFKNIIGALIVMLGVVLVVMGNKNE